MYVAWRFWASRQLDLCIHHRWRIVLRRPLPNTVSSQKRGRARDPNACSLGSAFNSKTACAPSSKNSSLGSGSAHLHVGERGLSSHALSPSSFVVLMQRNSTLGLTQTPLKTSSNPEKQPLALEPQSILPLDLNSTSSWRDVEKMKCKHPSRIKPSFVEASHRKGSSWTIRIYSVEFKLCLNTVLNMT